MWLFESERARLGREHLNFALDSESHTRRPPGLLLPSDLCLHAPCRGLFWDSRKQEVLETPVKEVRIPLP